MGWLIELILEIVGGTATDQAAQRMSRGGCILVVVVALVIAATIAWLWIAYG